MLIVPPGNPFGENGSSNAYHAQLAGSGRNFYQAFLGARDAVVREIESDVRGWLRDLIHTSSGDAPPVAHQSIVSQTTVQGGGAKAASAYPTTSASGRVFPRLNSSRPGSMTPTWIFW